MPPLPPTTMIVVVRGAFLIPALPSSHPKFLPHAFAHDVCNMQGDCVSYDAPMTGYDLSG